MNPKPTLTFNPTTLNTHFLFNSTTHIVNPHTTLKTRIFSSIQLHIVNPTTLNTHFFSLYSTTHVNPTTLKTCIFSSIKLHIVNPTTLNTHFLFLFNYTCQPHNTQHTFSLSIQLQKSWTHRHTHTHTHTQHPFLQHSQKKWHSNPSFHVKRATHWACLSISRRHSKCMVWPQGKNVYSWMVHL
jgi:hypothetical protein